MLELVLVAACWGAPTNVLHDVCVITNNERYKRGLPPMVFDRSVSRVAQGHAQDMHDRDYFSHDTPEGLTWKDRLHRGGIRFSWSGENIAHGYPTAIEVMQAWMNSQGHRENILESHFTRIGIGVAGDYFVQDFANSPSNLTSDLTSDLASSVDDPPGSSEFP